MIYEHVTYVGSLAAYRVRLPPKARYELRSGKLEYARFVRHGDGEFLEVAVELEEVIMVNGMLPQSTATWVMTDDRGCLLQVGVTPLRFPFPMTMGKLIIGASTPCE